MLNFVSVWAKAEAASAKAQTAVRRLERIGIMEAVFLEGFSRLPSGDASWVIK
jgi:hypothetical protein